MINKEKKHYKSHVNLELYLDLPDVCRSTHESFDSLPQIENIGMNL
jgi:hypothetical protein